MDQTVEAIHRASVEILRRTGFCVTREDIAESLRRGGVRVEGLVAYFTQEQLQRAVEAAPKQFTLYARNPAYDMRIGGGESYFAPGYGCTSVIDENGVKRAATYADYVALAKMTHKSELFRIDGGILAQPSDVQAAHANLLMLYAALTLSDKCVLGISSNEKDVANMMRMLAVVFGGEDALRAKPRMLTLVNTTSPLELGNYAADTIVQCVRYGQPLIVSPGPMAGATGPVSAAGTLAVGNAEALATIAIIQTLQSGHPVLYGLMPTTINMASGSVCIGSPVSARNMKYSARLAQKYGLPNRCGGALTDAKAVGAQSGMESMLTMTATLQEHTSFALHSAGILESFGSMSFEKFVCDLELIRMLKRYEKEPDISAEMLAVDEIVEAGAGGNYLLSEHTFAHFREESWLGSLFGDRQGGEETSAGRMARLRAAADELIESYERPAMDPAIQIRLAQTVRELTGLDPQMLLQKAEQQT